MPARRRRRVGDFLAVVLLAAAVGVGGWFWWRSGPAKKPEKRAPKVHSPKVVTAPVPSTVMSQKQPVVPSPKPVAAMSAVPAERMGCSRPVRDVLEAQVALARRVISPGSIDAVIGSQTRAAIAAFQRLNHQVETSALDQDTRARLTLDAPPLTTCTVTMNDLARLQPLGKTWLAKSQQSAMDYETILELIAEKAHSHPLLIRKLNPGVDWAKVPAGAVLKIPSVNYPEPADQAAFVVIHLSDRFLEAFDAQTNLLAHFPCSIAAKVEKRPAGELHVIVIAPNPNYTVDPALFSESAELQALGHKLILPPGPNNPVGVAWIGLNLPGYGMHGTPVPELVGRTESHGCFRLANWDAEYLVKLVWVGMPVKVVP